MAINLPVNYHPLSYKWIFYEHNPTGMGKKTSTEAWSNSYTQIGEFDTVEDFWNYYALFAPVDK